MVDILLSTYNGKKFLPDLLDSILKQTFKDWRLLVRDDCSTDNTKEILNRYACLYPHRIKLILSRKRLGPAFSFGVLLQHSNAPYMMFCDQDDVWLPDKITLCLEMIKKIEERHPGKPVLVFSDLIVVDENLNFISPSFLRFQRLPLLVLQDLKKLCIQNVIPGCSMIFNKAVQSLVGKMPSEAIMHDWWLALQVRKEGVISFLPYSLSMYRQHKHNVVGAKRINAIYFLKRMIDVRGIYRNFKQIQKMANRLGIGMNIFEFLYYKVVITFARLRSIGG
jgi:glycosyltransferase involved in cell wall biosynthesis